MPILSISRRRTVAVLILAAAWSLSSVSLAAGQRDIRVGLRGYVEQKINIAIDKPRPESSVGQEVTEILTYDLEFSLRFNVLTGQPQTAAVQSSSEVDYEVWAIFGTEYLVTARMAPAGAGFNAEVVLHHVPFRQEIQTLRVSLPAPDDGGFRAAVHDLSNTIIRDLTGEEGIADTRIAFASRRRGDKEIYVADYDGRDPYRVTQLDTISMTPDWRPDGSEICFMSFVIGDPDLYCAPAEGGRARPISSNKGLDMAPAWSPEGDRLAHTLTKDGNPEIYVRNPSGRRLRRLTYNLGIDTAPSWSPNGRMLVFESDRSGRSQIYTMDAEGADLRQITFGGEAHSPAWSPLGDRIAYVERIDGRFQVVTIDPDGGNRTVLTFTGDNEDPSWSPDGLHFAFSSSRAGGSDIYTMDWDGNNIRRVTEGGTYVSPSWSARLRPPDRRGDGGTGSS